MTQKECKSNEHGSKMCHSRMMWYSTYMEIFLNESLHSIHFLEKTLFSVSLIFNVIAMKLLTAALGVRCSLLVNLTTKCTFQHLCKQVVFNVVFLKQFLLRCWSFFVKSEQNFDYSVFHQNMPYFGEIHLAIFHSLLVCFLTFLRFFLLPLQKYNKHS